MACQVIPFRSLDASTPGRFDSVVGVIPKALETAPDMKLSLFDRWFRNATVKRTLMLERATKQVTTSAHWK